jgi:hypothetical protein
MADLPMDNLTLDVWYDVEVDNTLILRKYLELYSNDFKIQSFFSSPSDF